MTRLWGSVSSDWIRYSLSVVYRLVCSLVHTVWHVYASLGVLLAGNLYCKFRYISRFTYVKVMIIPNYLIRVFNKNKINKNKINKVQH